jgi:hypothetical protein
MAQSVMFAIPEEVDLGNVDIKIYPVCNGEKLGTLYLSKSGVTWHPKGRWKIKAHKLSWLSFAKLLQENVP